MDRFFVTVRIGHRLVTLALAMVAALSGCQKSSSTGQTGPQIDVCSLISQEEVQSIQGAPVKNVEKKVTMNGGFRTADCLYTSEITDHSVSIALVGKNEGSPSARDPKEYWMASFDRYLKTEQTRHDDEDAVGEGKESSERNEENKNIPPPPKKIDGLGDGAFWASDFAGGALYVLKGNVFIRIRVSGSEAEEVKIDQSKALAAKALARF